MTKIAFIGAGSTVFTKNLLGDILSYPELSNSTICLHDINEQRLQDTEKVARRIVDNLAVSPIIETTTDRRAVLDGANYAINMIQVGGYEPATLIDFDIPKKFGLRQTIGDTLGIGGIMRALRTIPEMLEMVRAMEELCPDVLHLNYVNPMAMITWALNKASQINTVGLCHSVPHTASQLSEDILIPLDEINYLVAGINHMAFYLRFERHGEDLYPLIRNVIEDDRVPEWNRVRYELFNRLGYFVTESSEHLCEYVPWFIKRDRPDLIKRFNIPLDEYLYRCQAQIQAWDYAQEYLDDPNRTPRVSLEERLAEIPGMPTIRDHTIQIYQRIDEVSHSVEYAGEIIHSIETGTPRTIYGNVPNLGLIDNLPFECCVEVPCLVDQNGIQPTRIGSLPPHLAALMQTNINVQALTVEAALTGNREHVYHAAMFDPHTAAELDLDQIWSLVDELIEAHEEWLPEHKLKAISNEI